METSATYHGPDTGCKKILDDNKQRIRELQSTIADLDATIQAETERCANADIQNTAGIRYAQRIQRAAFPLKEISGIFSDYFVFTKPLGIVTGDFYKALTIKNYKIFALADCAGHGVPGAFLTMLGIAALKESMAIHYNDDDIHPSEILGEMRQFVKTSLRSGNDGIDNINDGMNLTLCAFRNDGEGVVFAGANQNVYHYSNGATTSYCGDRMPIGWSFKGDGPFTETLIPAKKGDIIYLVTDSIQSQFGGPNNVKFSVKRLVAMLEAIAAMPLDEQKSVVAKTINDWVEGHILVDDLTVAGVRV